MLENGSVSYTGDTNGMDPYDVSTVATLSCNAGYSLVGEAVRTCVEGAGAEGEWSNGPSNCDCEFLNRLLVHVCQGRF